MKQGVLLVNKPTGYTSFDVIAVLRGILKERRLGHTGTLDPMATGVLPVLIGKAARAADILPDSSKSYEADFVLGMSTDTQDTSGETVKTSDKRVNEQDVLSALNSFKGKIMQLPPMYSAVSVNGKRLYELARQGIEVERQPREIEIFDISLISFDENTQSGKLSITCSKGTYIRTIINDLGERLGTYGAMSALVRTSSHGFGLDKCLTLDEIKSHSDIESAIISVDSLFDCCRRIDLSEKQAKMYKNGVKLDTSRVIGAAQNGLYRVYAKGEAVDSEFLGLCSVSDGEIRVYKNFWE